MLRKADGGDHIVANEADEYLPPTGIASRLPFLLIKAVVLVRVGVERQSAFRTNDIRRRRRSLALFSRFSLVEIQDVPDDVFRLNALKVAERTLVPPEGMGGSLVPHLFLPVHEQLRTHRTYLRKALEAMTLELLR